MVKSEVAKKLQRSASGQHALEPRCASQGGHAHVFDGVQRPTEFAGRGDIQLWPDAPLAWLWPSWSCGLLC